jgi:hypothetical protein
MAKNKVRKVCAEPFRVTLRKGQGDRFKLAFRTLVDGKRDPSALLDVQFDVPRWWLDEIRNFANVVN